MVPFHLGGYSYQEIPVNPNRISFTTGHRVIRPTVLGIGELNQVGPRKLKTIVWSSHFPEFTDTYVNYPASSLQTPKWWKDRFEGYQHKPLTLAITNIGLIEVTLDSFLWDYGGRTGKDINYEVRFSEYKQVVIRSIDTKELVSSPNMPVNAFSFVPTKYIEYKLKEGDTLQALSFRYTINRYTILDINKITNFDSFEVGQIIKLPLLPTSKW